MNKINKKEKLVPILRFKGFRGEWMSNDLGKLFDERVEKNGNKKHDLLSVTISNGVVKQSKSNKDDCSSEDKSNYKIVHKNDIAYNTMRMWQGASGVSDFEGIVSPAYTVVMLKDGYVPFYKHLFKRPRTIFDFYRYSQGMTSDTWNLKYKHFSEIAVKIPEKEEQKKIAKFLCSIDEWINNLRGQKEAWGEYKKGIMQKIFSQEIRFIDENGKDFPKWKEKN